MWGVTIVHSIIVQLLENMGKALNRKQAEALLPLLPAHRLDIFAAARLAASSNNKDIFSCGIINAKSGRCAEDCSFCAQSVRHGTGAPVYGLLPTEKLLERAQSLWEQGAGYMGIVISGTSPTSRDFDRLCEAAAVIRERVPIKLCASFGILGPGQARQLKEAGYASYHHNLETARSWYGRVCTTHAYEAREQTVRSALEAGLRVCCGGIFGLGEGWPERLELAETLQTLGVHSIPVNFLMPVKGTPLESSPLLPASQALDIVALFRLMHPEKDIVICGGRGSTLGNWENTLFFSGANAMMVGDYLTAKGSVAERDREIFAMLSKV